MRYNFEWDPIKAKENLRKHGIGFERATELFGDGAMKKEYDFSKGQRGKFYRPGVELNIPVYLEPDVAKVVRQRARRTDASIGAVVNEWLRKDIRSGSQARKLNAR